MRHLLLAVLLVSMTGCGPDTKPEAPAETSSENDQPSAEPPKVDVPVMNSIGMRFVPIPAGTFTMGKADYGNAHQVTLTQPFEFGVYEVTQEQYEAVMGTNPSGREYPPHSAIS